MDRLPEELSVHQAMETSLDEDGPVTAGDVCELGRFICLAVKHSCCLADEMLVTSSNASVLSMLFCNLVTVWLVAWSGSTKFVWKRMEAVILRLPFRMEKSSVHNGLSAALRNGH